MSCSRNRGDTCPEAKPSHTRHTGPESAYRDERDQVTAGDAGVRRGCTHGQAGLPVTFADRGGEVVGGGVHAPGDRA